jgi:hypothetical protein
VDDGTNSGTIILDNGTIIPYSSAHKILGYRNFKELANYQVWTLFHFLPSKGQFSIANDP